MCKKHTELAASKITTTRTKKKKPPKFSKKRKQTKKDRERIVHPFTLSEALIEGPLWAEVKKLVPDTIGSKRVRTLLRFVKMVNGNFC